MHTKRAAWRKLNRVMKYLETVPGVNDFGPYLTDAWDIVCECAEKIEIELYA